MTRHVLTLNAGSSSVKFALFRLDGERRVLAASGSAEADATEGGGSQADLPVAHLPEAHLPVARLKVHDTAGGPPHEETWQPGSAEFQDEAMQRILAWQRGMSGQAEIAAVGHRIVHGGLDFAEPVLVTDAVLDALRRLIPLAPLHQPHNIAGIVAARAAWPGVPDVACFDTAFHRGHPWVDDAFALPRRFYDEGIRRYGFHGLSYEYITGRLREIAPGIAGGRVVIAHLGNGASMCAVQDGRSVASTMGFTALDGLPMGTRCGQLDPGVVLYLLREHAMTTDAVESMLYRESGLKGLSGLSGDMRALEAAGTPEAAQALDYFVFRIRRELGGLAAVLGGLDAVVFCGGIGEHAWQVRARALDGLAFLGIAVDDAANRVHAPVISTPGSAVRVMVVPTDEEAMIAAHTVAVAGR